MSSVIETAGLLRGQKSSPDLPIPYLAIREFARDRFLSPQFAGLVYAYDQQLMIGVKKARTKQQEQIEKEAKRVKRNRPNISAA